MKALRRSIKRESETKDFKNSLPQKSLWSIQPPKKVIKALYDYAPDAGNAQELSFTKGDFFHVISREDDPNWYEAFNPLVPDTRGLVPVSFFEVIGKTERQSTGSAASGASNQPPDSGYSTTGSHAKADVVPTRALTDHRGSMSKGAMVYGVVQYDFNAERPDELEAKAGEYIIVIAQSNPEWFVAKPIGRLGGPGLIPVSFIEIRDMSTGQAVPDAHRAVQQAGVPKVEEWKKMAAEYKNNSITLGKFEVDRSSLTATQNPGNRPPENGQQPLNSGPLLAPLSAHIPRYCFENNKYWYIIECVLEDGSHWELSRYYQDFYDLQIALISAFPAEADTDKGTRILPYMPGPVTYVTDAISNARRESLNEYVKKLLILPPYISRCERVRMLFQPTEGDFELDPKTMQEDYRLSGTSQQSSSAGARSVSQHSAHGPANGNGHAYGASLPQQQRANHTRNQLSQSPYMSGGIGGPAMQRQPSSLTQASSTSNLPASADGGGSGSNGGNGGMVPSSGAFRIKVFFEDDCIAIRVPTDINFAALHDKLKERLKVRENIMIQYKDEPSGGYAELLSDRDLDVALTRNPKLTLYVGYA